MYRVLIFVFLFLFSCLNSFAFGGRYIGLGLDNSKVSYPLFYRGTNPGETKQTIGYSGRSVSQGLAIIGGYGKKFSNNAYFGIEGQLLYQSPTDDFMTTNDSRVQNGPHSELGQWWGLNGRLGVVTADDKFMPYLLFGADFSQVFFYAGRKSDGTDLGDRKTTSNAPGWKTGAGLEYKLWSNTTFRGEYYVAKYREFSIVEEAHGGTLSFKPTNTVLRFAFAWYL